MYPIQHAPMRRMEIIRRLRAGGIGPGPLPPRDGPGVFEWMDDYRRPGPVRERPVAYGGLPIRHDPLMPEEGIVGPGPAGYFGPNGEVVTPGMAAIPQGMFDPNVRPEPRRINPGAMNSFAALLATLLAGRTSGSGRESFARRPQQHLGYLDSGF